MRCILIIGMLFLQSACSFSHEPKSNPKLLKVKIGNLSSNILSLKKECKSEDRKKVNFKKIDGFIEFAKKHSYSTNKIKILNDDLGINDEILHIIQAYDLKEIKNFAEKKKCRTIIHDINSEYNAIKKELGYK